MPKIYSVNSVTISYDGGLSSTARLRFQGEAPEEPQELTKRVSLTGFGDNDADIGQSSHNFDYSELYEINDAGDSVELAPHSREGERIFIVVSTLHEIDIDVDHDVSGRQGVVGSPSLNWVGATAIVAQPDLYVFTIVDDGSLPDLVVSNLDTSYSQNITWWSSSELSGAILDSDTDDTGELSAGSDTIEIYDLPYTTSGARKKVTFNFLQTSYKTAAGGYLYSIDEPLFTNHDWYEMLYVDPTTIWASIQTASSRNLSGSYYQAQNAISMAVEDISASGTDTAEVTLSGISGETNLYRSRAFQFIIDA
ncbi:MAG: hypothetical protein ACQ5SW_03360 [Sphaerochaetaceae bacterium]